MQNMYIVIYINKIGMSNDYFVNVCKEYELLYYAYHVFDKMFELHVSAHEFEN